MAATNCAPNDAVDALASRHRIGQGLLRQRIATAGESETDRRTDGIGQATSGGAAISLMHAQMHRIGTVADELQRPVWLEAF